MKASGGGVRAILARPSAYDLWSRLVGGDAARRALVDGFVRPWPGARILDLGCGTADMRAFLGDVTYVGVDHSARYVAHARARFGARADVRVGDIVALDPTLRGFDVVTVFGVLHHLDDAQARALLANVASALRAGGRCVAVDNAFVAGQSRVARAIIAADRGGHVRSPSAYEALARTAFGAVTTVVRHDLLRVPYSHCITLAASAPP